MFDKSLIVLKKNPMIFIMMAVFMLSMAALSLPMISETNKMVNINPDLYNSSGNYTQLDIQESIGMMVSSMIVFLYTLVLGFISIVFMSGYGNMIATAMNEGKASLKVFFYGIKRFIGKVLLSALLMAGIIIGFSIVISLITTPFVIASALSGSFNAGNIFESQKMIQIITIIIMIFLYPLLFMWLPAIFTDRREGVINCFKNGFKASRKKYLQLLPACVLMLLPTLLMYLLSENIYEIIKTPYYFLIYPFQAIILPVIITYLFVMYKAVRSEIKSANYE